MGDNLECLLASIPWKPDGAMMNASHKEVVTMLRIDQEEMRASVSTILSGQGQRTIPTERPLLVGEVSASVCGVVVRIPSYRSRGPGFNSQCYQIFWEAVDLERGDSALWG
jgi:hypothetical protein